MIWYGKYVSHRVIVNIFSSFLSFCSCLECSGLPTVLPRCLLEMNSKQRSPFLYIPSSFCIFTFCHYILVCDWNFGPFTWTIPRKCGVKNKKVKLWNQTFFFFFLIKLVFASFFKSVNSRDWGCWEYIDIYIYIIAYRFVPLCLRSIKCIRFLIPVFKQKVIPHSCVLDKNRKRNEQSLFIEYCFLQKNLVPTISVYVLKKILRMNQSKRGFANAVFLIIMHFKCWMYYKMLIVLITK